MEFLYGLEHVVTEMNAVGAGQQRNWPVTPSPMRGLLGLALCSLNNPTELPFHK